MTKIKVILVDDHEIVRDGIKALLNSDEQIEVIGEAQDGDELFHKLKSLRPDIILLDISLPRMSGIEIIKILKAERPGIKVLVLSMYTGEDFIYNAIKAGAKGYLPKNTTRSELLTALKEINNGNEFYSESITKIILGSYIKNTKTGSKYEKKGETLSLREVEVLKLVAEGLSNSEIAGKLFISIRTVESHKNHIMQKLGLNTPGEMIKYAIKNKIIEI